MMKSKGSLILLFLIMFLVISLSANPRQGIGDKSGLSFKSMVPLPACGDYYKISQSEVGHIVHPEYPDVASNRLFCIWLIEAPQNYRVNITILFQGDMYKKSCVDYLQVRTS
ncbi:tolloid protein 2 [Biomphalaria glabrata]|nr:tolloid protein 2 [Biomphalaria glabrata]